MNVGEWAGLILSLLALVITIVVFIYDAIRKWYWKIPTISWDQWVALRAWRDSGYKFRNFPMLVALLPIGMSLQAIGILIHFLAGLQKKGLQK